MQLEISVFGDEFQRDNKRADGEESGWSFVSGEMDEGILKKPKKHIDF